VPLLDELKDYIRETNPPKCPVCNFTLEEQDEIEKVHYEGGYSYRDITAVLRKRGHVLKPSSVKLHVSGKHRTERFS